MGGDSERGRGCVWLDDQRSAGAGEVHSMQRDLRSGEGTSGSRAVSAVLSSFLASRQDVSAYRGLMRGELVVAKRLAHRNWLSWSCA